MENTDGMDEFIEMKYLMMTRTALKLEELQETLNDDDQGLFEFLLSCVDRIIKEKKTHISPSVKNNLEDLGLKEIDTNSVSSNESDEDILKSLYEEDIRTGRRK